MHSTNKKSFVRFAIPAVLHRNIHRFTKKLLQLLKKLLQLLK